MIYNKYISEGVFKKKKSKLIWLKKIDLQLIQIKPINYEWSQPIWVDKRSISFFLSKETWF